jgi:hypothetical protein
VRKVLGGWFRDIFLSFELKEIKFIFKRTLRKSCLGKMRRKN